MATLYTLAESNVRKSLLYLTFIFGLVIALGWFLSQASGSSIFLWIAVVWSVATSFLSYWYSDRIILAITRAKPLKKEDNPELYRIVENLTISAGLPMPRLYLLSESQPNAFATGRDPKNAVIAVTQGLLEKLDRAELEGVLAHELAHIGNRDILIGSIAVVMVGIIALLSDFFFRISFWGGHRGRTGENGQARLLIALVSLLLAILAPLIAQLIRLAISRKREFLADATGALITRYPEGLARALEKISRDANPMRVANDATSHLFISDPFRGKEKFSWLHKLFMTHPPIEERVKALRGMQI